MTTTHAASTGAENVRWNLADLYTNEEGLREDLVEAEREAERLAETFRGRIHALNAGGLAKVLQCLEKVHERVGRAHTYAYLHWSTNTQEATRGALLQEVREAHARIAQHILFFDVEWVRVEAEQAQCLISSEILSRYRHFLECSRLYRDHVLSEAEEKVLVEKDVTGRSAWMRYFSETMGAMRFTLDGEALTQQQILAKLHDGDRALRQRAALAFTEGLRKRESSLVFIFNTLLADKAATDRLRSYPHWIRSRNLSNEINDETAEALIQAVIGRCDLVARFYTLKRQLLGYETLHDYDRYAPLPEADTRYHWEEAKALVLDSFSEFHPRMGAVSARFFDDRWIDAPVVPGKQGGAYSHSAVPSAHPYVLMNYTGRARDVQTLAHELGHGVHQYLARDQGVLQADTPLTMAETASVFGELLVFQELLRRESDPRSQLALLVSKIDDTIATVFRQIAMNRFEDAIHQARRTSGELSSDGFADFWMTTQEAMFQGSVRLGDHYRHWWCYIPHFLHTPGYVYAYAFGELLVLSLYARYEADPAGFPDRYLALLSAGGSDWPHVLVERLGIDLQDPGFWAQGLEAIEHLIARAEALAAQAVALC